MQVSKRQISKNLEHQFYKLLYQVVADIHQPQEAETFLKSLLKQTELKMVARRLAIAYWLDKGHSYEDIKNNLSVSSATVSIIANQIKQKKGFETALAKIRADEWADRWAKKINQTFKIKK